MRPVRARAAIGALMRILASSALASARALACAWALTSIALPAPARAAAVGEIALVPDVGRQITQAALLGNRYVQRAACAFYQDHADRYDVLFVFTTIPASALTRGQQGWATRSVARGIGRDLYRDSTADFCSTQLRHAVKMSDIGSFSDDPDAVYTGAPGFTLSGVQVMGHELGHQWLAMVRFDRGDGERHCKLRGFTPPMEAPAMPACDGYLDSDFVSHWSAYFDTGSVMYGNRITDLGGGRFRLENRGDAKYSELDQYLMGLRDPAEVAPMFYVDVGAPTAESAAFPVPVGQPQTITGTREDLTVQDVIRAEGPRVPARERCHLKAAFVLVHDEATAPTPAEIARVDAYRRRFEAWYADATDRRGSFDTTLAGSGAGTVECPAVGEPPPRDAGVVVPDAGATADAGGADGGDDDAGDDDAASTDAARGDAGARPDAAELDAEAPPRTLVTEDCACTTSGRDGAPSALLLALVILGAARSLRLRRR